MRNGTYHLATKAFEQALSIDNTPRARASCAYGRGVCGIGSARESKQELLRARSFVNDLSTLAPTDSLYLQAITDSTTHNFKRAVETHRQMVEMAPDSEKVYALVDLGRAYDRNGEPEKALESLREATKRDPLCAAAFLQLGVLESRNQELEKASASFDIAEEIYRPQGDIAGQVEVHYQRGTLYLKQQGKTKEAKTQFERTLEPAGAADNEMGQLLASLQLSEIAFIEGDTVKAEKGARRSG
ncbi:MAG: tetratricopeptide repeat protein [Pyrinomonadaceae bacterium]